MAERTWLECDDLRSFAARQLWLVRARRAALSRREQEQPDADFACIVAATVAEWRRISVGMRDGTLRLSPDAQERFDSRTQLRERSRDDASDRPWLKAKPLYPTHCADDEHAAIALVASLSFDPPRRGVA